jgi:hypothetical protein
LKNKGDSPYSADLRLPADFDSPKRGNFPWGCLACASVAQACNSIGE